MKRRNKRVLIAVAWPYVNGDLHVGHLAGYLLPADTCARFHRFLGDDVVMVSGSDCFGTPTVIEADKRGISPEQVVEEYHAKNLQLFEVAEISFDLFTRTDTENHIRVAQDVFVRMAEEGLIFIDTTEQYYSPHEHRFLPDRYVEGECPKCGFLEARSDQCDNCNNILSQGELINPKSKIGGKLVELKETEHYFIDWPKLQIFLEKYVSERSSDWRDWVREETLGWLRQGVKARAISRDLDWGVPIPTDRLTSELRIEGAEHKRIYVWFEAVLGYLSATIEWAEREKRDWKDFWYNDEAEHYYFMGKDNLVFHTLFLPGELSTYDKKIHLPDYPVVNQFLNLEGRKFSKSRGVTIDSKYIIDRYGSDSVRFYLTLISPENADTNFSWDELVKTNNNILIGNLGNYLNRSLTLGRGMEFSGKDLDKDVTEKTWRKLEEIKTALMENRIKAALDIFLELGDFANKYLAKEEPWKRRADADVFQKIMQNALYLVIAISVPMKVFLPDGAVKISSQLKLSNKFWPANASELQNALREIRIDEVMPLYAKIDEEVIIEERSKITK